MKEIGSWVYYITWSDVISKYIKYIIYIINLNAGQSLFEYCVTEETGRLTFGHFSLNSRGMIIKMSNC
jgi:hypothetical protein